MHWPCALFRAQPGLTQRASPPLRSLLLTSLRCPVTVLPKSSISLYILQTDRQTDMCDPLSLCSPTSSWHRPFFLPDLPHLHCFLAMSLPGLCHTDLIVFSPQFSNEPTPMCPLKHQLPPPHSSISSKKKKKRHPLQIQTRFPWCFVLCAQVAWGNLFPQKNHPKQTSLRGELCGLNCGPHTWVCFKELSSSHQSSQMLRYLLSVANLGMASLGDMNVCHCLHAQLLQLYPPPTWGLLSPFIPESATLAKEPGTGLRLQRFARPAGP